MAAEPKPIPVGQEPPPLGCADGSLPIARQGLHERRAKRRPNSDRQKTANRFAVLNAFVDAGMCGLPRVEVMTWMALFRDTRDGTACTSAANVAARIGCSRRAVTKAINQLRQRGMLVQVFRGGLHHGPSRYRVLPLPKAPGQ